MADPTTTADNIGAGVLAATTIAQTVTMAIPGAAALSGALTVFNTLFPKAYPAIIKAIQGSEMTPEQLAMLATAQNNLLHPEDYYKRAAQQ